MIHKPARKVREMTSSEPNPNRSKLPENYSFDDSASGITIHGSQSDELGTTYWPPRLRCPQTGGSVSPVDLATTGILWSWSYVHLPWMGDVAPNGDDEGYGVGMVDLDDDGPRLAAVLMGSRDDWHIGAPVTARELPYKTIDGKPQSILAFERSAS